MLIKKKTGHKSTEMIEADIRYGFSNNVPEPTYLLNNDKQQIIQDNKRIKIYTNKSFLQ